MRIQLNLDRWILVIRQKNINLALKKNQNSRTAYFFQDTEIKAQENPPKSLALD
jgi:hypothetical protein